MGGLLHGVRSASASPIPMGNVYIGKMQRIAGRLRGAIPPSGHGIFSAVLGRMLDLAFLKESEEVHRKFLAASLLSPLLCTIHAHRSHSRPVLFRVGSNGRTASIVLHSTVFTTASIVN